MKENISKDLKTAVERIQDGTFTGVELRFLLMTFRSVKKPKSGILKELGDFVAHNDERIRGILYDHIRGFMARFISFAMSERNSATIPGPLFGQKDVMSELIKIIRAEGISGFEESQFRSQTFNIMFKLLEIVAGTKIGNAPVNNCRFSAIEQTGNTFTVYFCFGPVKGSLLNVTHEVKIPALIAIKD